MNVGTRVHHRRYPHLVGRITSFGPVNNPEGRSFLVRWESDLSPVVTPELESDLRATPVQPRVSVGWLIPPGTKEEA